MPPQRRSKGKKKQPSPGSRKLRFPDKRNNEILGRVVEILGNDHMRVQCEDGKTRLGRIRGKIKKRMWIRLGEIVITQPWDWETARSGEEDGETLPKCDIIWRYQMTQTKQLFRRGLLPPNLAEAMNLTEEDLIEERPEQQPGQKGAPPPQQEPEQEEPGEEKEPEKE